MLPVIPFADQGGDVLREFYRDVTRGFYRDVPRELYPDVPRVGAGSQGINLDCILQPEKFI
jgi:hypothetical protein